MNLNIKKWFTPQKQGQLSSQETEFLPAVLEVTETPPSPVGRVLLFSIMVLLTCGLLWSVFGHVDEVAVANGKIVPVGQVKVVQAEDKGVVRQIYVKEGQIVKKGELLIELDRTVSEADLARTKKEMAYYNLEIERLLAEQQGVGFAPTGLEDTDAKDVYFQTQLYQTRMNEYQTKLAAAQSAVAQQLAAIQGAESSFVKYSQQLVINREKETRMETLFQQNAVALFQLMDVQARSMELEQNVVFQQTEIARFNAALAQSKEQLTNVTAEHERDLATKLVEDRKQVAAYAEELKKADEKNRLAHIVAPEEGKVGQLAVHTVGGVVTAAQALMIIVPEDATLEVEAWVANKDIGFIKMGQKAEIKVATFNFQKYGIIDAQVAEISPDAVSDEKDKEKDLKYRVVLHLDKDRVLVSDKDVLLSPGMSVAAEIKIREKRIIEFFLDPFRKYQSEALRER
jgi:hemolysin D